MVTVGYEIYSCGCQVIISILPDGTMQCFRHCWRHKDVFLSNYKGERVRLRRPRDTSVEVSWKEEIEPITTGDLVIKE